MLNPTFLNYELTCVFDFLHLCSDRDSHCRNPWPTSSRWPALSSGSSLLPVPFEQPSVVEVVQLRFRGLPPLWVWSHWSFHMARVRLGTRGTCSRLHCEGPSYTSTVSFCLPGSYCRTPCVSTPRHSLCRPFLRSPSSTLSSPVFHSRRPFFSLPPPILSL